MVFLIVISFFLCTFLMFKILIYYTKYSRIKSKIESYFDNCKNVSFHHPEFKEPNTYIGFGYFNTSSKAFIMIEYNTSILKCFSIIIYNYKSYSREDLSEENLCRYEIIENLKVQKEYSFTLFPTKRNIERSVLDFHKTFKEITFDTVEKVIEYDKKINVYHYEIFYTDKYNSIG